MYRYFFNLLIISTLIISACSDDSDTTVLPGPGNSGDSLIFTEAFPLLDFTRPIDLQHHGDDHLFVVEQSGIIRVFNNDPETDIADVFIDLTSVVDDSGNEEGLLGLAFHPNFIQNGYFYVNYTSSQSTTRISRFEVDAANQQLGDPASELILLEFNQPFGNHNGGQLAFGSDGYLYISVGDGGSGGDPQGNSQNRANLLGNILRIDVDNSDNGLNYGIPADNPFVGNQSGFREEIYAYGLRNPWRMSFDSGTGALWVGDVGQNQYEEIDIVTIGKNYGWKIMEADECFQSSNCDMTDLEAPYFGYSHDNGDGSITGGFVYRGSIDELVGQYIYADYTSGRIWALETGSQNPQNTLLFDTNLRITTFGIDSQQELYICGIRGKIFKFDLVQRN
jgi:hypothetical protein